MKTSEIVLKLYLLVFWATQNGYPNAAEVGGIVAGIDDYFHKIPVKRPYRHGTAKIAKALSISRQHLHTILEQEDGVVTVVCRLRALAYGHPDAAELEKLADSLISEAGLCNGVA